MHIVGVVNETNGGIYYVVKNSWGEISDRKGYVYVSESYMRLNTISLTLNKNALPKDIRQRMGIEPGDVTIEAPAHNNTEQGATSGDDTRPAGSNATKQPASFKKINANMKAMPAKKAAPVSKE